MEKPSRVKEALQTGQEREQYKYEYEVLESISHRPEVRELMIDFLARPHHVEVKQYAIKPDTFGKFTHRFSIEAKRKDLWHDDIEWQFQIHMDAEFGYMLMFTRKDGSREPIAIIGFNLNREDKTMYIEQLQGGGTQKRLTTSEGRRALFKIDWRQLLYDMVVELAIEQHCRAVAVRKAEHSQWDDVSEDQTGRSTHQYDDLALKNGHKSPSLLKRLLRKDKSSHLIRKLDARPRGRKDEGE
jgi:hypothetical protein